MISTYKIIPILLALMLFLFPNSSVSADKRTQHTEGDQAPNVNVGPGGKSIINYGATGKLVADIVPEIRTIMTCPLKLEKNIVRKQIDNPDVIITNVGPQKVVGFSVDLASYLYDKRTEAIEGSTELRKVTHGHFVFKKELEPAEEIKMQVNGYLCQDKVAIYVFEFKYYREADMMEFKRREIFFMENYKIIPEKEYAKKTEYPQIIQAIKSYQPPTDSGRTCLQGIDDHTWYLEETPKAGIVSLTGSGKALNISGIPEDPRIAILQSYVGENRPVLYIKPSKLKETGIYLNPKIINSGTVNISFKYEVENVGNTRAIKVSEVGRAPHENPLIPGGKIYLNSGVTLVNTGRGGKTAQDLLAEIEKKEFTLEHHDTFSYYQESRDEEYIVKLVYRIGKDSVQLIKYELN